MCQSRIFTLLRTCDNGRMVLISILFYPDVMRYAVFQCQFHVFAEDDRHRALLEDGERLLGGKAVGKQLFALQGVDFFAEFDEPYALAGGGAGEADAFGVRSHGRLTRRRKWLIRPPMKKADGMMSASIRVAVRNPCSLMIIMTLAMQGTKRVSVTMPTTA